MTTLFKNKAGKLIVLVATVCMIGVNVLATFPIINGKTTQAVSDAYPNLFTPVGSTFSIWGIIYLALLIFALLQLGTDAKYTNEKGIQSLAKIRLVYTLSCLFNIIWLFLWQYELIPATVLFMLGLLLCLILIMLTIKKTDVHGVLGFFLRIAFGLYLGWITVATIANITVFLVSIGWEGGGIAPQWWMVGILIVAALIGCSTLFVFKNTAYGLVLLWAFWGILQQHLSSGIFAGQYTAIVVTVIICMVLFFIDTVLVTFMGLKKTDP